jgi:hypothetical protein
MAAARGAEAEADIATVEQATVLAATAARRARGCAV